MISVNNAAIINKKGRGGGSKEERGKEETEVDRGEEEAHNEM
jgi:hypothetical protein